MKKQNIIVDKKNKEYQSNIQFASDSMMSPAGVDILPCENKTTGEKWTEICTKLSGKQEGQFRIEIL